MRAVAEGGILRFAATAGPDRTVFFDRNYFRRFARALVGAIAVRRVFGLAAGAESKGLAGGGVDFVGRGLPTHELIIEQSLENESANCGRWKEDSRGKNGGF